MKKYTVFFALGAAVCGYVWYLYESPYLTVKWMAEAAAAKDTAKVAQYIDFPALRESVRPQVEHAASEIGASRGPQGNDPFANFARGLASSVATRMAFDMVDQYVSPEGLDNIIQGRVGARLGSGDPNAIPAMFQRAVFSRPDLSHTVITLQPNPSISEYLRLILTRTGLSWKLTGASIPPSMMKLDEQDSGRPTRQPSYNYRNNNSYRAMPSQGVYRRGFVKR